MTKELQAIKKQAQQNPDTVFQLITKGVGFGTIVFDSQAQDWDTSGVEGVDEDLVLRPFGRKGEFATVRGFDVGALQFHFGMQPVEEVGPGRDDDGDGVVDEILIGELSALHVFNTNLERPRIGGLAPDGGEGLRMFQSLGCATCHVPNLDTKKPSLPYAFPEVEDDPTQNVFLQVDLHDSPAGFDLNADGGLRVPLFSDLKRHDMGPELAETFGHPLDAQFITARLWEWPTRRRTCTTDAPRP